MKDVPMVTLLCILTGLCCFLVSLAAYFNWQYQEAAGQLRTLQNQETIYKEQSMKLSRKWKDTPDNDGKGYGRIP